MTKTTILRNAVKTVALLVAVATITACNSGGTVATESYIQLKIDYDWGRLTDCLYQEFDDNRTILVSFTTK